MTFFWLTSVAMILAIVGTSIFYSRRLYANIQKKQHKNTHVLQLSMLEREQSNLELYKNRYKEINNQLELGDINQSTADALQFEAKKQLLSDISDIADSADLSASPQQSAIAANITDKRSLVAIILMTVCIPVCAIVLYLPFGFSLGSIDQWKVRNQLSYIESLSDAEQRQIAITDLVTLLEQQTTSLWPDEALLNLLAEVHLNLGEYSKSVPIYEQLVDANSDNAYFYAALAEALYLQTLSHPKSVSVDDAAASMDNILQLLTQSLEIQPQEAKALSLSGMLAFQQENWQKAIDFWESALVVYPAHSSQAQTLNNGIASARKKLGQQGASHKGSVYKDKSLETAHKTVTAAVRVSVSIDKNLLNSEDSPSTPVFIFARPANGSRMPLAAKRITLADLPADIVLTDHDRMTAQTIASHSNVIIGARLARSGQPIPKAGDIDSKESEVTVNHAKNGLKFETLPSTALHIDTLRQ